MGDVNVDLNANSRCQSTGDSQLDKALHQWLAWDKVSPTAVQNQGRQLQTGSWATVELLTKHPAFKKTSLMLEFSRDGLVKLPQNVEVNIVT